MNSGVNIVKQVVCAAALFLAFAGISFAFEDERCELHASDTAPRLCPYEPTTIGYTQDRDDSAFMDFKLSLMYQLFPHSFTRFQNQRVWSGLGDNSALYFAFTGRFGQYLGTRDSSPVVGKRFNPKLFYRFWYDEKHKNYVDVAYAHESNGQSIDSLAEYQTSLAGTNDKNAVKDQLSRGWDYDEIIWKHVLYESDDRAKRIVPCEEEVCKQGFCENDACKQTFCKSDLCREDGRQAEDRKTTITSYVDLKLFRPHGLLQGAQENYNAWENDPEGKNRDRVSGIAIMIKLIERGEYWIFQDLKTAALYETGFRETFRYNTYRLEVGTKYSQLPITLWRQIGYNSDLAQYFKKVDSYGINLEIGSF